MGVLSKIENTRLQIARTWVLALYGGGSLTVPPSQRYNGCILVKGGFHLNVVFLTAKRWFNRIISFTFSAIQKPFTHYTILSFGFFDTFLGDFWVHLEGDICYRRIG